MKFLLAAVLCSGVECIPVEIETSVRRFEDVDHWCELYSNYKISELARGFIPRTELTVQEGSLVCIPIDPQP